MLAALGCTSRPARVADATDRGPETGSSAALEVRFLGLESDAGRVACALFEDRESFDSSEAPARGDRLLLEAGRARWMLELPYGDYAIKAFHDLNDNGTLDRNALEIPSEPYGFSNDARGRLGPPRWEEARFRLDVPRMVLEIRLR
jgi:uncharacterized protein (DUF2141 family)